MEHHEHAQKLRSWLEAHRVVNASGTMTGLGASSVSPEVAAAVEAALPAFVDMHELQALAGRWIARLTGAEAGCVTASAAAGIAIGVAGCITGSDIAHVESLPDLDWGLRKAVLLQKGHSVDFGSSIPQMVRLSGASVREVGTAISCEPHHLESALTGDVAAALFVVSHHTVQSGMLGFPAFVEIAHAHGVPVVVDAASEYDLRVFIEQGADLVLYSSHKFLGGPTAGIVAGRTDLVRAAYINQSLGIGRAMKVGKESIVGMIAALMRWERLDHRGAQEAEYARLQALEKGLRDLPGMTVVEVADPTGNPITRLRILPAGGPPAAARLVRSLLEGAPPIVVRSHHIDLGFFELDPCNLLPGDVELIIERFTAATAGLGALPGEGAAGELGPRHSRYAADGRPGVNLDRVPWGFPVGVPSSHERELLDWPQRYGEGR